MPLPIANERGERLVDVLAPVDEGAPMIATFALVIATIESKVLLVRNTRRNVWELPGGWLDGNESPEQCALRELHEESGQRISQPLLQAWIVLESSTMSSGTGRLVGAVFCGTLVRVAAFPRSAEISGAGFWVPDHLPAGTSSIDAALISAFGR